MVVSDMARAAMAGDMTALVPLINLLEEAGDRRRRNAVVDTLCWLEREVDGILADQNPRTRDYRRAATWRNFKRRFKNIFWLEITGDDLAETVSRINNVIDAAKLGELEEARLLDLSEEAGSGDKEDNSDDDHSDTDDDEEDRTEITDVGHGTIIGRTANRANRPSTDDPFHGL
jgi:hypothetical protein